VGTSPKRHEDTTGTQMYHHAKFHTVSDISVTKKKLDKEAANLVPCHARNNINRHLTGVAHLTIISLQHLPKISF